MLDSKTCDSINTAAIDESSFFDSHGINWDAHRIGWLVAGIMTILTVAVTTFSVTMHCRNYNRKLEQRQIVRILLMPSVYAIITFFSYRYFREYTYYTLVKAIYEAIAIAAFLFLLLQFIGDTQAEQKRVLDSKDKRKMLFPFCCWRYRPSKPYFFQTLKWSVLQYVWLQPIITIIAIICEATGKLCPSTYSIYFAEVYLDSVSFVVFSVALYGLIVFAMVTRDQLKPKSPLNKFLTIKGMVFLTFYQGFIFDILQSRGVIHGTEYWTATNVSDGLQALCVCVEMVLFAILMFFSFSWKPYKAVGGGKSTPSTRAFIHAMNFSDFVTETWKSINFYIDYARGKPGTSSKQFSQLPSQPGGLDFDGAYDHSQRAAYSQTPGADNMEMQDTVDKHVMDNVRGTGSYAKGGMASDELIPLKEDE